MPSGYTACDTCIFNCFESEPTLCGARTNGAIFQWCCLGELSFGEHGLGQKTIPCYLVISRAAAFSFASMRTSSD